MPVATMLAIAASFWSSHGYAIANEQVTWEWAYSKNVPMLGGYIRNIQAYTEIGSNHIYLYRPWWDKASNLLRCLVVIHEDGHAALGFRDIDDFTGNIMNTYDDARTVPGACKRKHW